MVPSTHQSISACCFFVLFFQGCKANSEAPAQPCSEGDCVASAVKQPSSLDEDPFDESSDLSLVQLKAIEKRALETSGTGTFSVHHLDGSVRRKDLADVLGGLSSEGSAPDDPFSDLGSGCCDGPREESNGKLYADKQGSLDECKAKCLTFDNCGIVEYGWPEEDTDWCYIWDTSQSCEKRDLDCKLSNPGVGTGVKAYKYMTTTTTSPAASQADPWSVIADGCCDGDRNESNGKLYGDREQSLDACKAKCLTFDNCGIVEYGWTAGDPLWCYIWDTSQKCETMDTDCKKSVLGVGTGAKAYKYAPDPWTELGPGCCDGDRDESNGKLYGDKEESLDACKAKCLEFENCGIVEYGWSEGDPLWCYIWDDSQQCAQRDLDCKKSVLGVGTGAQAYKYNKP